MGIRLSSIQCLGSGVWLPLLPIFLLRILPWFGRIWQKSMNYRKPQILASKDLRTPKKSYLQWDSTWCQGLLLVYESNNQTNWATEAFATREIFKLLPMHHFIFGLWSFRINRAWLYKDPKVSVLQANASVAQLVWLYQVESHWR